MRAWPVACLAAVLSVSSSAQAEANLTRTAQTESQELTGSSPEATVPGPEAISFFTLGLLGIAGITLRRRTSVHNPHVRSGS